MIDWAENNPGLQRFSLVILGIISGFLKAFSDGFLDEARIIPMFPAHLRAGPGSILQAIEQIRDKDACGRQNPEAIKKLRSITTIDASKTSNKNTNKK